MLGIWMSMRIRSYCPSAACFIFRTAISPSSADSTSNPASFRISTAISRFSSLSSTSRIFFPLKASAFSCTGLQAGSAPNGSASTLRSSERNSGFSQKAVTPAARASSSISAQS